MNIENIKSELVGNIISDDVNEFRARISSVILANNEKNIVIIYGKGGKIDVFSLEEIQALICGGAIPRDSTSSLKLIKSSCDTSDNYPIDEVKEKVINIFAELLYNIEARQKIKDGYVYGKVENKENLTTPTLIPYDSLSEDKIILYKQKAKDNIELLLSSLSVHKNKFIY